MKEKNVVNALPDNKSGADEVKNNKSNPVNDSFESDKPSDRSNVADSTIDNEVKASVCKVEEEEATNRVVTVSIPEIKIDVSEDNLDNDDDEESDQQAEWEWEEGEEMEYEFYEHEVTKLWSQKCIWKSQKLWFYYGK